MSDYHCHGVDANFVLAQFPATTARNTENIFSIEQLLDCFVFTGKITRVETRNQFYEVLIENKIKNNLKSAAGIGE